MNSSRAALVLVAAMLGAIVIVGGAGCEAPTVAPSTTAGSSGPRPVLTPWPTRTPTSIGEAGTTEKKAVSAVQYGDDWPLTVSSGWVSVENCVPNSGREFSKGAALVFTTKAGKKYALNGFALERGYPNIQQITQRVSQPGGIWLYHIGNAELQKTASNLCPHVN